MARASGRGCASVTNCAARHAFATAVHTRGTALEWPLPSCLAMQRMLLLLLARLGAALALFLATAAPALSTTPVPMSDDERTAESTAFARVSISEVDGDVQRGCESARFG